MRDAVVVSATLPRFLDVGDRSQMSVDIDNVDGEAGDYTLDLDLHGPLTADADALRQTLHLDAHQRRAGGNSDRGGRRRRRRFRPPPHRARDRSDAALQARRRSRARRTSIAARSRRCRAAEARPYPATSSPISSPEPARSRSSASPFGALDAPALAAGARPLPLRLLRADGQPGDAAPLRQPPRLARKPRARPGPRRPRESGDRARDEPAERQRRLRHVGGRQRRRRRLARRLRHRFPHPRPRAEIRRRRRRFRPGARPLAQHGRQRARAEHGQRRRARLCALRAGAQRPSGDRRSALSLRRQARRLRDAARQGAARRGAGDARRPRPRRQGLCRRA